MHTCDIYCDKLFSRIFLSVYHPASNKRVSSRVECGGKMIFAPSGNELYDTY